MAWYFSFFLLSGFCSILYELVWLRLAMAQFGVTTPVVSTVLSMFMAGIGLGSWAAGRLVKRIDRTSSIPPLRLYAFCELLIGSSALVVPFQFSLGHRLLESLSGSSGLASGRYYLISLLCLAVSLVPWCACMGATIPLAMAALRSRRESDANRSFSFLYVANLFGAILGATAPLLLIEAVGFHDTLRVAMFLNFSIAAFAFILSRQDTSFTGQPVNATQTDTQQPVGAVSPLLLVFLFLTGLISMSAEVVWIRLFTPSIGPMVYSFALILASYLVASYFGAQMYRTWSSKYHEENKILWVLLPLFGLLPLLAADARLPLPSVARVLFGIVPFSCAIGFLTPMFVDRWSQGDPKRAGSAYAINVVGCIAGPLLTGFLLLPYISERLALLLLTSPFFVMAIATSWSSMQLKDRLVRFGAVAAALSLFFLTSEPEAGLFHPAVSRDSTATVIAAERGNPSEKVLLVNGINMTGLSLITKHMAHLTLASHEHPPQNTLVICFGMGTTFRSALSWGVPTTAVDLVPSVPRMFPYFYSDAAQVLASPGARVIADDGRRFLERTSETFDTIIIDPPPPLPAAGSSLLYSKEFYALAKHHLRSGGLLQQWLPGGVGGDRATWVSVVRALRDSFPYIRIYGYRDNGGIHFLASMTPIPVRSPAELAARLPAHAAADLVEWNPALSATDQFAALVPNPISLDTLVATSPDTPPLQDDRPVNEYFLLRSQKNASIFFLLGLVFAACTVIRRLPRTRDSRVPY